MYVWDYHEAGLKVFGLYGGDGKGGCGCGDVDCKAAFKHPRIKGWQRIPAWSDEQMENMEAAGHFQTGFAVLCNGLLVVDIDPRNGGSLAAMQDLLDPTSTFTVATGGGGWHVYFKAPEGVALVSHLEQFKGVDFKSSGGVVGAGSMHASGCTYEPLYGNLDSIAEAPAKLIELLKVPERFRVSNEGAHVDMSTEELADILERCDPDLTYPDWIKVGMALHHVTGGSGIELFDSWSKKGEKYGGFNEISRHWYSFGRCPRPAGLSTLLHFSGGRSVEFVCDIDWGDLDDLEDIDLRRPPGFLGELTQWIDGQSLYPIEHLSLAVALQAVSALSRGDYKDEHDGLSCNLLALCIAGSGVGKESALGALTSILSLGGQAKCLYGGFKSEQEIGRNLIRDRCSTYAIDEFGIMLGKVSNAKKSGAHYLEGVTGIIMSVYSKANSAWIPSGDAKTDMAKGIQAEVGALRKMQKEGLQVGDKIEVLEKQLLEIDEGIKRPFLSLTGFSTPITFDSLMTYEMATNGFLSRAIIVQELETNPKRKEKFKRAPMEWGMEMTIRAIAQGGGTITTTEDAADMLNRVYERFWDMAEREKGRSGLEAIPRRGYEIAAKISLILAVPSGLRTANMVRYGFALALQDCEQKIKLAYANFKEQIAPADALAVRIMRLVSADHGETRAVICNRLGGYRKENVNKAIDELIEKGIASEVIDEKSQKKPKKIFAIVKQSS